MSGPPVRETLFLAGLYQPGPWNSRTGFVSIESIMSLSSPPRRGPSNHRDAGECWVPAFAGTTHEVVSVASCRRLHEAFDRLFDDGKVDQRGQHSEQDREPPHCVVGAGVLIGEAAEPDAQEAADLMAEEREPCQHCEPPRAEHRGNQPIGGRD